MPKRVRIAGRNYHIVQQAMPDDCGDCDPDALRIIINPEYPEATQQNALLHEVIHGIEKDMELNFTEKQVSVLATVLLQVMRENPPLVAYLLKKHAH